MIRKRLVKEITIEGRNLLRKKSSITFLPAGKPGWWLRTTNSGDVPIDHRIAKHKEGRIQLCSGGVILNVWEHIGALRFMGIDGVIVVVHDNWPPFLGGMRGYRPYFLKDGVTVEDGIMPTIKPVRYGEYESYNHMLSSTAISPSEKLILNVRAKWGDLPWYDQRLVMEELSEDLWEDIWDSKPQGWPKGRSLFFTLLIRLFKKLNRKEVAWIEDFPDKKSASYRWGLHRVQDILGCASLCSHIALPIMHYDSYLAGHKEDLIIHKQCFSK